MALILIINKTNRKRSYHHLKENFNRLSIILASETETRCRYRFNHQQIQFLVEIIKSKLSPFQMGYRPLSPELQVMAALRYFASGAYFRVVADSIGIEETSVRKSVWKVTAALNEIAPQFIKFPKKQKEIQQAMQSFYSIGGFPNVLGAIDGTQIKIRKPPPEREEAFYCRKQYHSLNVQFICNGEMIFTNCFARYPGSFHDSRIWRNSAVREFLESVNMEHCWLLGDSGYPLEPWLLTPIINPQSRAEERYVFLINIIRTKINII